MKVPRMLCSLKCWSLKRSLWVFHVNTGGCNGCDIEILDAFTPRYDVERFGIRLVGTPRHADVLVVTGPVNSKTAQRLLTVYEQTPDPKFVVVVGTCAATGGIFKGAYNIAGGVDNLVPVHAYVIGCPPRPESIIDAVAALIGKIEKGDVKI
ncbi:MAG: NADH-quinone oxidoreductase subunit B family protein [Nitrososphaeria archaeon]